MMDLAPRIDSTNLRPDATALDIISLCEEARVSRFAAVCINPYRLSLAAPILQDTGVKIATVIAFPLGADTAKMKYLASRTALEGGAGELDMVMNIGAIKDKEYNVLQDEIESVLQLKQDYDFVLKIIVETALLDPVELAVVTQIISAEEADYIKTSTGFSSRGVSIEDISLINQHKSDKLKIKASGGIKDVAFALRLLSQGVHRIGTSNAGDILRAYNATS